jgi:AcrR family transcriptional regulator
VRERIVRVASEELRRSGLAGIVIPALMKRAGLTHGAFYAHFPNRDALVAEAIRAAAGASAKGPLAEELPLEDSLEHYLSGGHLAHPERGCVIAALGGEGARQPEPVRSASASAARGLLAAIERKLHPRRPRQAPGSAANAPQPGGGSRHRPGRRGR